jgi:hypothetical protein
MTLSTTADLPHWHDDPEVFDALFLGGQRIPGVVTVKVSRKVKIDKKSPKGKNKAVITKQGVEAAEVDITIRLLSPEDFEEMKALMPLLEPVADKKITGNDDALDIAHWATWMRNVEAIIIEDTDGPELKDGIFELHIKAVEFERPKTASGTTGTGTGTGGLKFGFFLDQLGVPLPGTYVARQGDAAKKDDGKPLIDENGKQVYVWQQLAIMSEVGLTEVGATFLGTFFSPDGLIKIEWEKFHPPGGKPKDVTTTPQASKGGADLGDFANPAADPPDPTDTDGGP